MNCFFWRKGSKNLREKTKKENLKKEGTLFELIKTLLIRLLLITWINFSSYNYAIKQVVCSLKMILFT